jgi:hypothetical protein
MVWLYAINKLEHHFNFALNEAKFMMEYKDHLPKEAFFEDVSAHIVFLCYGILAVDNNDRRIKFVDRFNQQRK